MPNKRPPPSIASFGPQLFQALIEGAKRPVEVPLSYRRAVRFTQRLHSLRALMRELNHDQASVVAQAKVSISWPESTEIVRSSKNVKRPKDPEAPCTVTIAPADHDFTEILKRSGISVPDLKHEASLIPPNLDDADPLAAFVGKPDTEVK